MGTIFQNPLELVKELDKAIQLQDARHKYDIERLQREINRLKDPLIKSKTIAELEEEIKKLKEEMQRGFGISKPENERICKWQEDHLKKYHNEDQSTAKFEYLFIPTPFGTTGTCICGTCKQKQNMNETEYSYKFAGTHAY